MGMNVNPHGSHHHIAEQYGLSKEEMIEKFGEPGETPLDEVIKQLNSETTSETTSEVGLSVYDIVASGVENSEEEQADNSVSEEVDLSQKAKDDKYLEDANALNYDAFTVSAIEEYVANGDFNDSPDVVVPQVAYDLGLPENVVADVLDYVDVGQNKINEDDSNKKNTVDIFQVEKDTTILNNAEAIGVDALTYSAVANYVENNDVTGPREEVVPKVAYDLGLPEYIVQKILDDLDSGI